jgi:hypothetical protein
MIETVGRIRGGSKVFLVLFVLTMFRLPSLSSAQDEAGEAVEPDQAVVAEKTIKRDPFWPVGYTTKIEVEQIKIAPPEVKVDWVNAEKVLRINGIGSREDADYALINGQIKVVGDVLKVKFKNVIYTWEVESIHSPNTVKLRQVSAQ